jgi:thiol-disulfide isomerase/thioredoxin
MKKEARNMGLRSWAAVFLTLLMTLFSYSALPAQAEGLDLGPYKGKVVYLDFWASWCNPCRQSFPWMNELQEEYAAKGLVVIAVNVDHDRDLADEFLQSNNAQFKIVYDPNGKIAERYDFKDMPTSILIGRDGAVRFVHNGFYPNKEGLYASHINALLNEKGH